MPETEPQGAGYTKGAGSLEAFLEEKTRAEGMTGLSVAVVKDDRIVWERGFGFADLATSTPATSSTSYLWFSMTKIVTATAVMRLAEGGYLDLDAPADEYFRGFKVVSQPTPATIRHLLSHSSGLARPSRWLHRPPRTAGRGRPATRVLRKSVPAGISLIRRTSAVVGLVREADDLLHRGPERWRSRRWRGTIGAKGERE